MMDIKITVNYFQLGKTTQLNLLWRLNTWKCLTWKHIPVLPRNKNKNRDKNFSHSMFSLATSILHAA